MAFSRALIPLHARIGAATLLVLTLAACGGGDSDEPAPPAPPAPPDPVVLPDPLQSEQWHLHNTGQAAFASRGGRPGIDLNVTPVHEEGIYGQGVKVMVIDSGLESTHEDLAANVDRTMLHSFDPGSTNPDDAMPPGNPPEPEEMHGTAVAGIIGAVRNNQKGGIGVAPDATLGGIRFVCEDDCQTSLNQVEMFGRAPYSSESWLFNGSYGGTPYSPVSVDYDDGAVTVAVLGLARLRSGKGALFVKAAGNEFRSVGRDPDAIARCEAALKVGLSCHNPNSDADAIPPTTIVVGGVNADGAKASYSSAGSNLLVAGTSGEYGLSHTTQASEGVSGPGIIAPDFSGCNAGLARRDAAGYASDFDNPDAALGRERNAECNYTAAMNGTSSAAPSVSGVIALMLSANPDLTWRDVRDILVRTSRSDIVQTPKAVSIPFEDGQYMAEPGWQVNGAGRVFSSWYGYGLVDAAAAVREARQRPGGRLTGNTIDTGWLGSELEPEEGLDVPLARLDGASDTVSVSSDLTIEAVVAEVYLDGDAPLGDIAIELISPAGTRSVLMTPHSVYHETPAAAAADGMLYAANIFYGEKSGGDWTLRVLDANTRGATQSEAQLLSWAMRVYGH